MYWEPPPSFLAHNHGDASKHFKTIFNLWPSPTPTARPGVQRTHRSLENLSRGHLKTCPSQWNSDMALAWPCGQWGHAIHAMMSYMSWQCSTFGFRKGRPLAYKVAKWSLCLQSWLHLCGSSFSTLTSHPLKAELGLGFHACFGSGGVVARSSNPL